MTRRHRTAGGRLGTAALVAALAVATGCSDDVTCPVAEEGLEPYVAATAVEGVSEDGRFTTAHVFCTADPLPGLLTATINDRQFDATVPVNEPPGLTASLMDTDWIWAPGIDCVLEVTIDADGIASATVTAPDPPRVLPVGPATVGDSVRVSWRPSSAADYYNVRVVLRSGGGDSLVAAETTRGTTAVFAPEVVPFAGELSGRVSAVAGPLPEVGADGNVSGFGWGLFTFSVYDSSGLFSLAVEDRRAPRRDR